MKIKLSIKIGMYLMMLFSAFDAECTEKNEPKNVAQIVERNTGGKIISLYKTTKKIYYINAQNRVKTEVVEAARKNMETALRTPINIVNGSFHFSSPKIEGELSLYIIDDAELPLSLIAPEGRWAFVNVAHLAKGRGEKPQFLEARFMKETARIACMLFGGISSSYRQNLLSFVGNADYLDKFETDKLPIDGIMRCQRYLLSLGVKPYRQTTYRKACEEGWAPAPTNDVQKAIWDKVHATPKNPIRIEFDPKKGR